MTRGDGAVAAYPLFQGEEGGSIPTSPLQLRLYECSMRTAQQLNRQWHSMLPRTDLGNLLCGNMSVAYLAEYDDYYYAVAILSQPIIAAMCDKATLELRRLAICDGAPRYTASRMLSIIRRLIRRRRPEIKRLISYQAVDVHQGTIYRAAGWRQVGKQSAPRPQRFKGDKGRATGPLQTTSPKVRWECSI